MNAFEQDVFLRLRVLKLRFLDLPFEPVGLALIAQPERLGFAAK